MIKDALNGEIDLIITKSVSRFARNTVDSLATIRKLKEKNVECFFEKENIYTFDSKGELLITIMSSLAQEESRSISENVTIGKRWGFQNGKFQMPYDNFLGYEKGPDGKPQIVEWQADIVRRIYSLFIKGKSYTEIKNILEADGVHSPSDSKTWSVSCIASILKNEKYKGDALLQKTFVTDFLTHKCKKNQGEIDQYYIKGSHPYIIPPEEWEFVQLELKRREDIGRAYNGKDIFSCKLICGDCGGFYGKKVWHSNSPYRTERYRCNKMFDKNHSQCKTPILTEKEIQAAFINAYNSFIIDKESLIEDAKEWLSVLDKQDSIQSEIDAIVEEMSELEILVKNLINENATKPMDQDSFQSKYNSYKKRYETLEGKLNASKESKNVNLRKLKGIELFIQNLDNVPSLLEDWDSSIWIKLVEKAIINNDRTIKFILYSGKEIETMI